MLRVLAHMFVVSVLAPAAGGAIYTFCQVDWHEATLILRFAGSVVGGFVLLAFVWFWTVPLGLLTYPFCLALQRSQVRRRTWWILGGIVTGLLFGQFIGTWASIPIALSIASGISVGALTGFGLRRVWLAEW